MKIDLFQEFCDKPSFIELIQRFSTRGTRTAWGSQRVRRGCAERKYVMADMGRKILVAK